MKHLKYALETCVYSHSNICNIQIHFCNVSLKTSVTYENKHLKHTCATIANICNIQMKNT
jgi:hypothetical protein